MRPLAQTAREMLERHLNVGPKKAVSYLPIRTIEKVIGISINEYVALIEDAGNRSAVFLAADCCINSGAIYAYSPTDKFNIAREPSSSL